ncbi:cytochrome C biogenesis protein CcmE [Thiohalorhabdus denitrificans]|uniref:Cytochrome c-type biogenesis protein CcmE n=1 Tax=Thiohalorhabdus denitrificans TaxID=381306 RepID=A0A0P9EBT3_9GAMM|nr:cytochrome c maturation protein CcmE [Thiohalorhabdus denitrificans]KPV39730.1 cytochrome C biogenesis protein CcmE [Thiohalorhabdus denitrificans]SCX91906.1 cytochrome c-type biogenesis protein CcmE [Thiohalorhabdus denitrificans]
MTPRRKKRLYLVLLILIGVGGATALGLTAFRENLVYFYSPSEIAKGKAPENRTFRIGGLVKEDSVERDDESLDVRFVITDTAHDVPIEYSGILPDLFREGQGIVANGKLNGEGVFLAEEVLAKHDEEYMPPEAAEALEKAGGKPPHSMADK